MNMSQILSISRSGLNAYQREMDVVSNNLANVDTLGYKDKRTTFQELLNQRKRGRFVAKCRQRCH